MTDFRQVHIRYLTRYPFPRTAEFPAVFRQGHNRYVTNKKTAKETCAAPLHPRNANVYCRKPGILPIPEPQHPVILEEPTSLSRPYEGFQSAASSSLIFEIAAAGLRPFGQVRAQLKMVWHRYKLISFWSRSLRSAP